MPYGEPDPDDPNVLVGVALPGGPEAVREMAFAFAEEFAAMGYEEERLLALFRRPFYAGAHRAYRLLGEEAVRCIVAESVAPWRHCRVVVRDAPRSGPEPPVQIGQIGRRLGRNTGGE